MSAEPETGLYAELGRVLRAKRGERTQDEIARQVRRMGLRWTRSVVAAVETGRRSLGVHEWILLSLALKMTPRDWFDIDTAGKTESLIGLARASVPQDELHSFISNEPPDFRNWRVPAQDEAAQVGEHMRQVFATLHEFASDSAPTDVMRAVEAASGDAELNASRKLGVEPEVLSMAAVQLWDRTFQEERDARTEARLASAADASSVRTVRGHMTRGMLKEVEAKLEEAGILQSRDEGTANG